MEKNLKIGIDFHGVISASPEAFGVFCHEIRRLGVMVYVISGGPLADVRAFLMKHGIEFDEVWAIADYYCGKGDAKYFDDGSFFVPTELWDKAKGAFCAKEGILFHIDDSPIYGKHFVTPYCQYDLKTGGCWLNNGVEVDFNEPKAAAQTVAHLINGLAVSQEGQV
ncbi:MAG: hypothetical protein J6C85_08110 [Alphaproteobacteria bacterium]|nr:hypothetical protein [Alphaproteobacteria bacterium]